MYYLSCSVGQECGYIWLSWVVCFKVLKGCIQGVSPAAVSSEAWLGKDLLLSSHGVSSTWLPMDCQWRTSVSCWILGGGCPHLTIWAFPISLLAPQSQLGRVSYQGSLLARQVTVLCNVIMGVLSHHLCHILFSESHSSLPHPKALHNGGIPGGRDHGGYLRVCLPWCLHLRKCFSVVASLF